MFKRRSLPRVTVALFAVALLASCCLAQTAATGTRFKVMSYNIRIGVGGREWTTDPRKINQEPVARVIEEHAPDLVGLQEVDEARPRSGCTNQPAWLAGRLKMNVAFVPAYTVPRIGAPEEKYGVALLSRWQIDPAERIPLFKPDYSKRQPSYPDYYSEQRALMRGPVTIGGQQVQVFVTHLGLTAHQREKQFQQIVDEAAKHPGPRILMGDFNAQPSEPAMALLRSCFRDALAGIPAEARYSFPAGTVAKGAIDHIYVSPEFRVLSARVVRDVTLASDHNPVLVELELPFAKAGEKYYLFPNDCLK
jgi:endonuclease/exonuclease/phosphatase family metal-dependent hydrolase